MYQGTTPSLALQIEGYDLTGASVFLTLENGKWQRTLENDRLVIIFEDDVTTIAVNFSQEETYQMPIGTMKCQVRWVDENSEAWVTEPENLTVSGTMLKKVIKYAGAEEE